MRIRVIISILICLIYVYLLIYRAFLVIFRVRRNCMVNGLYSTSQTSPYPNPHFYMTCRRNVKYRPKGILRCPLQPHVPKFPPPPRYTKADTIIIKNVLYICSFFLSFSVNILNKNHFYLSFMYLRLNTNNRDHERYILILVQIP